VADVAKLAIDQVALVYETIFDYNPILGSWRGQPGRYPHFDIRPVLGN
jgi:hypothetical protein